MYTLIQYITFLVLTVMGFNYLLNGKIQLVKGGFNKQDKFPVTNHQYLLLFIFMTAIIGCGGSLMALRLMVCIVICFMGLFLSQNKIAFTPAILFYILYLSWLVIEILLSPVKGYGFRVFLKYLYPFLIMLFACKIVQTGYSEKFYLKVLNALLYLGLFGACWSLFITRIPIIAPILGSIIYFGTAIVDFMPVVIVISLLLYSYTKQNKYLLYALIFVLPSILGSNRTGLLAASITIAIFAIVRYKVKSLPYVALGIGIFIGTVLYVPAFRDKMFFEQMSADEIMERRDELTMDDINTSGRSAMWEWSLKNFYEGKEWQGSGLGTLQEAFQNKKTPFQITVIHNDYIQILCDTGLIGLILYAVTMLSLVIHSISIYLRSRNPEVIRISAFIAGVSLAGMLSTLYTDNVVNYSLMTISFPFALYGLMLGLKLKHD